MKRVLLATTALFALSGVTVAAADVSISGHVRFHYDSWSDNVVDKDTDDIKASANNNNSTSTDLNIWVKGNMVTDNGLTVAPVARIEGDTKGVTRHYIRLSDDWGTIILGNHHTPAYTMSLGADWRGTVSGAAGPGRTGLALKRSCPGGEGSANAVSDKTYPIRHARQDMRTVPSTISSHGCARPPEK